MWQNFQNIVTEFLLCNHSSFLKTIKCDSFKVSVGGPVTMWPKKQKNDKLSSVFFFSLSPYFIFYGHSVMIVLWLWLLSWNVQNIYPEMLNRVYLEWQIILDKNAKYVKTEILWNKSYKKLTVYSSQALFKIENYSKVHNISVNQI